MKVIAKFLTLGFLAGVLAACTSSTSEAPPVETVPDADPTPVVVNDQQGGGENRDGRRGGGEGGVTAEYPPIFYFEFDKSALTAETRVALDAYAESLTRRPRDIRLEGHADERGTREYNIALGERRAKAVADYLIGAGVSAGNIETISYGEERPAEAGSNSAAWSQNRRVELVQ